MCLYIWWWCVSLLVGRGRARIQEFLGLMAAHWQARLVQGLVLMHWWVDLVP